MNNLTEGQLNVLNLSQNVINEVKKVVIGKDDIIIKIMLAILAGGHILIEDVPGVGKTTVALAFSKALSLKYKRMQFTPDVLPADVTGFSMFNKATNQFEYKEGAAMTNLFLADEINRTSPKTQSALLEVMEEGKITVDGVTYKTPEPYVVIATQNPLGSVGTQSLPESQLDRFLIKISMGYPEQESEVLMLKSKQTTINTDIVEAAVTAEELIAAQKEVEKVYADDRVLEYIALLAKATRNNSYIKLGISPRGSIALLKITKATALLKGRNYALPDDVLYCFNDVAAHRILFSSKARINGISTEQVLKQITASVPVPNLHN